jgi:hypothetical protein
VNKVVETRASRETTPPPSNGQPNDQKSASKGDSAAEENGSDPMPTPDPLEEIQEQPHPFD